MNLYQNEFRNLPVTLVYNNNITSFEKALTISKCYKCDSSTTIPYAVCSICAEECLGFKICYSKLKGHFIINKIPRKKNQIWYDFEIPDEVLTYHGEYLTKEDIDGRYGHSDEAFACYVIRFSCKNNIYIDSCSTRCLLSLLNSNCQPTCSFIKINEEIRLKFLRDVDVDEELTVYYDYDINNKNITYQPDVFFN